MTKELQNTSILISGSGSAGQSLGYWLNRYGFNVTVVERAPGPRKGGFAIDLRGTAVEVAERMGILDACRKVAVNMREITRFNADGEVIWQTDGNFGAGEGEAGDVEILRDDLTDMLQEMACEGVEYVFSDSVTSIEEDDSGVNVTNECSSDM
ncbi:FAD-dependent monooxygenase [Haliea salexigens]|uniref:FAD-dependent monooxygenase n=1 Tax=Haliea salexigens TaxID=287487 RepID=UPI000A00D8BA|nr:FAD-dependent monooxygenase [Haliea salexigens]